MGATSTQGFAVAAFLAAFILIAAAIASGMSWLLFLLGIAVLAVSCGMFVKLKAEESRD